MFICIFVWESYRRWIMTEYLRVSMMMKPTSSLKACVYMYARMHEWESYKRWSMTKYLRASVIRKPNPNPLWRPLCRCKYVWESYERWFRTDIYEYLWLCSRNPLWRPMCRCKYVWESYGVAASSRLLKIIGLFFRIVSFMGLFCKRDL